MSALELDDATPAWRSWATVRLGLIRGAVFAPAVMIVTTETSVFVAAERPRRLDASRERSRRETGQLARWLSDTYASIRR